MASTSTAAVSHVFGPSACFCKADDCRASWQTQPAALTMLFGFSPDNIPGRQTINHLTWRKKAAVMRSSRCAGVDSICQWTSRLDPRWCRVASDIDRLCGDAYLLSLGVYSPPRRATASWLFRWSLPLVSSCVPLYWLPARSSSRAYTRIVGTTRRQTVTPRTHWFRIHRSRGYSGDPEARRRFSPDADLQDRDFKNCGLAVRNTDRRTVHGELWMRILVDRFP